MLRDLITCPVHSARILNPARYPPADLIRVARGSGKITMCKEAHGIGNIACAYVMFGLIRKSTLNNPLQRGNLGLIKDLQLVPIRVEFHRYLCAVAQVHGFSEIAVRHWEGGVSMSTKAIRAYILLLPLLYYSSTYSKE